METMIIGWQYTISLKILVTGGAGFIGRYLVDFLQNQHEITIYDNLSNSTKESIIPLIEKGVYFVQGDILEYNNLVKSCVGFDLVIHLAAKSDVAESVINPEITNEVNVIGTENILKCCAENKIKKLIFASSAAVYGDCNLVISETTNKNPMSPYGKSKLLAEQEIENFSKDYDLDAISLRLFNVYGSEDNQLGVISKFIKNISNGKPIVINGDGKQTRDFVSINDVIEAFECAIQKIDGKKGDAYNVASGNSISIKELVKIIIDKSGEKIEIKYKDQIKGDIKNSIENVSLASKELGFVAKYSLEEYLSENFKI